MLRVSPWIAMLAIAGCGETPASLMTFSDVEAGDERCPTGGVRIDVGIDNNTNGTLDPAEINESRFACNGSDGTKGSPGDDGEDGDPGECAERPPVEITEVAGVPEEFYLDDEATISFTTNADPASLTIGLLTETPAFYVEDMGSGDLLLRADDPTYIEQALTAIVSDGCSTAIHTIQLPSVTPPPLYGRVINADMCCSPYHIVGEILETGEEFFIPGRGGAAEGQAAPWEMFYQQNFQAYSKQVPYTSKSSLGVWSLAPLSYNHMYLWDEVYTDMGWASEIPADVPAAGEAILHVVNLDEDREGYAVGAGTGELVAAELLYMEEAHIAVPAGDNFVGISPLGTTPGPGVAMRIPMEEPLVDGQLYTIVLSDEGAGVAGVVVPNDDSLPTGRMIAEVWPLPLDASGMVEIEDHLGAITTNETTPVDWVGYSNYEEWNSDPKPRSWRRITVPGAARVLLQVHIDTEYGDAFVAVDGNGDFIGAFSPDTPVYGDTTVGVFAEGDTIVLAMTSDSWGSTDDTSSYPGYQITDVTYE